MTSLPPAAPRSIVVGVSNLWGFLGAWWFYIDWALFGLAVLSIPSVIVARRGRPAAALAWIFCLTTLPALGLLLWWLIGRTYLERRRRRKRHTSKVVTHKLAKLRTSLGLPPSSGLGLVALHHIPAELAESVFPPTSGNRVVLIDSKEAFEIMERDILAAKHHVHALFYIWKNDETGRRFRDILIQRAQEGIQVRVLCDAWGSPAFATRFAWPLRRAGAKVERFLPPQLFTLTPRLNFRNHRKILVVDGAVGFVGGFNIADEYRMNWRDMGVRIEGPAVDQLQETFAEDWYYASHEDLADADFFGHWEPSKVEPGQAVATIASGPDSTLSAIEDALFVAINATKRRLHLVTPYFIPSRAIQTALRAAVYRGVEVKLMLPARSDVPFVHWAARSYYPELLAAGARIFEYGPAMLHAKIAVFDDELVLVGSANIDNRSFRLNFEASCFVGGKELNQALAHVFEEDLRQCSEIKLADLERRFWGTKLVDATAHLLSPLL
jgi:cardiolipin synthase A/B